MTRSISKKVCLLGDFAVGKTSLVRRFVYDLFEDKYLSTIGVKVSRKTVAMEHDGQILDLTLMLWDLASGEEFDRVRASYLRGASGAVLVSDLTRPETTASLPRYVQELQTVSPAARVTVAFNKADLLKPFRASGQTELDLQEVQAVASNLGAQHFLTSAKTGDEVEALFRYLAGQLVDRG